MTSWKLTENFAKFFKGCFSGSQTWFVYIQFLFTISSPWTPWLKARPVTSFVVGCISSEPTFSSNHLELCPTFFKLLRSAILTVILLKTLSTPRTLYNFSGKSSTCFLTQEVFPLHGKPHIKIICKKTTLLSSFYLVWGVSVVESTLPHTLSSRPVFWVRELSDLRGLWTPIGSPPWNSPPESTVALVRRNLLRI